jgi:hypothetical protein
MDKREEHYEKVKSILTSCKSRDHLKTAVKVINQFIKQYKVGEDDSQYDKLKQLLTLMKVKCRVGREEVLDEDLSASGKEFKTQAGLSGSPDLQKIKFEGEDKIEGGVADDTTPEELSKKHNVRLKDIVDEIKVGKKIEREHTNSDDTAEEITMDHIEEFPDYYTNKKYGVKSSEKGLEKFNKKRIKKKDIKFEEEIEESSTAGSSGAFVGTLGGKRKPIKRSFYKGKVPVSSAGGMTKPIGKMYSFRSEGKVFKKNQLKETNVFSKKEMLESTDGSSIGIYDSPGGWGNNKFMGTKGKKGNAVQRKGNDHKVTYKGNGKNLSTFVKVKEKCKTFPYCIQDSNAIEMSKTPFKEGLESINKNKEKIKDSWVKFLGAAKREGKETTIAAGILKKVLLRKEVSEDEYRFLKEQSIDIAKIFGVLSMGVISSVLPLVLEKLLNKKGISILPTKNKPIENSDVELIESICKQTGKSKKYVHSLINKYL